jgi:hypothetical protein
MSLEYADLIPVYPSITDPQFQTKISAKKEFSEVSSTVVEAVPGPGEYFKHQQWVLRYLRAYPRLFLIHEAGTGKTPAYISVAEDHLHPVTRVSAFVDALMEYYDSYKGVINHIIILVKGPALVEEVKRQIVCKFTNNHYLKEGKDKTMTIDTEKFNKAFTITTYTSFANNLLKDKRSKTEINESFRGTMFVADELHSVKNELVKEKKDKDEPEEDDAEESEKDKKAEKDIKEYARVYGALHQAFHAPFTRLVAASATPMINSADELIDEMNLILPEDNQIPKSASISKLTPQLFRKYFMGYISMVRVGDTGVTPTFEGRPLDKDYDGSPSQLVVYRSLMSSLQAKVYNEILEKYKKEGFRSKERQASCFVYPDGSYGGTVLRRNKTKVKKGMGKYILSPQVDIYQPTKEFRAATNSIEKIRKLSCVYAEIIEKCLASDGICYIYSELLFGSGIIALAMCFESLGVTRMNEFTSVFTNSANVSSTKTSYCGEPYVKGRKLRLKPQLRYGLVTSETSTSKDEVLLELLRSPENKHGKYVKIIMGSRVFRDGINLSNVTEVHLPSMWTPSGLYQALQRAIRATSHVDLLEESKDKKVEVKVYRHAAISKDGESVDLDMYGIVETKDRIISNTRRKLREVAVDCHNHYERNVRPDDVDYSPTCDYQKCELKCMDPAPKTEDISTYRLLYSGKLVDEVLNFLHYYFSMNSSISFSKLSELLPEQDPLILSQAITESVQRRKTFLNRFGQISFLDIDGENVYLSPFFQGDQSTSIDSYYRSVLIIADPKPITQIVAKAVMSDEELSEEQEKLKLLEHSKLPLEEQVKQLTNEDKAKLIESTVMTKTELTPLQKFISQRYKKYLFEFREPEKEIQENLNGARQRALGRGRKPKENKVRYYEEPLEKDVEIGEKVFIHSIYTIPVENVSYNITTKYVNARGRLRILKPSEKVGWRDTDITETAVYNALIRGRIRDMLKPYKDYGVFGTILSDNEFRIHDASEVVEEEEGDEEGIDRRTLQKGMICEKSANNSDLIELAYKAKIPLPSSVKKKMSEINKMTKSSLIERLTSKQNKGKSKRIKVLETYPLEKLRYMYAWELTSATRPLLCGVFRTFFLKNNLMFEA